MEIDVSEDMIYYIELGDIKRSNLDMTDVEIFEENACAHDMTVDWIGRRIFYVKSNNIIQQISLNSKNSSVMRFTPGLKFNMITFDPIKGYLFSAEEKYHKIWIWSRISNNDHVSSVSLESNAYDLTLDMGEEEAILASFR
ncbi:uncharacterized protein LOC124451203 [Xenia sp. Carnegie-2017]|uniref:uncharacterized protein LOC124451203 n=1 Tax=Xenia sp. Carnegie-2017 TaxID=2897299 RepID=UPI001F04DD99|nr:uncharacterized protein LOC124451203 [Xenia sp. Carnegie-2017]